MESNLRPVVEIIIGGKPYHFLIDTGGVMSEIDIDVAAALGLDVKPIKGMEIYGVGGDQSKHYVRVKDILDTPDLLLGMNVLSKLHVYISYKEDKVYFTGATAH